MNVLELFAGSRSIGKVAEARGHKVFSSDIQPFERIDHVGDILKMDLNIVPFVPDMVWASPPCFIGRELVLTARGHVPISKVLVGDLVLTHKSRWRRVEKIGRKKVLTYQKTKGYGVDEVCSTSNHPFLVRERKSWVTRVLGVSTRKKEFSDSKWEEAKNIVGKHWAVITKAEPLSYFLLLDPYLVGRWLGDGWSNIKNQTTTICCSNKESDELESILKSSNFKWNKSIERTVTKFTTNNLELATWLIYNFGSGAKKKLIPGWVYGSELSVRENILKGYVDSDGYVTNRKRGNAEIMSCSSISKSLSYGILFLARTLGMNATITKYKRPKKVIIEGREVNQNDSYVVTISKKNDSRNFFTIFDDDLGYGKVRSKETISWNSYVYDIQVEEDHSYTINNVVVHNCTAFSVASMGKHWGGGKKAYVPKTEDAKLGMALAMRSIEVIEHFKKSNPNLVWYMENPRGVLRHMPFMMELPIRNTITYCKYGDARMKPTDIWTNNSIWVPRPMCKNNGHGLTEFNGQTWALDATGRPCHFSAPRGAKTGTQGLKGDYERSKLPPELCLEIVEASERFVTIAKEKSLHWSNQESDPS